MVDRLNLLQDPTAPPLAQPQGAMPMDPMAGAPPGGMPQMAPGAEPAAQAMPTAGPPPMPPSPSPAPPVEEQDDLMPIYPKWLVDRKTKKPKKSKKPTAAYCDSAVTSDQMRYSALITRFRDDIRTYRMMDRTVFDDLKRDDLELFVSASPAIQVHKISNMISNIEHVIQFPYKNDKQEVQAQRLENAAYYVMQEANLAHRRAGNTDLKWDLVFSDLVYGRMYTRVLPDPTDPEMLCEIRTFDPATVFPVFGGKRGLIRVSCVYNQTVDQILQTYGDQPGVNKKILKKFTEAETGKVELNYVGQVREYWDEWYRWIEFDGEEIIPVTDHNIGRIPWAVTIAPGQMGNAQMPDGGGTTALERHSLLPYADQVGADIDLTQKGLSFFHHQRPALAQQAAILSIQMTAAKQRLNPPMAKKSPYPDPGDQISMTTGDTNYLRPGEEVAPLLPSGSAVDVGVVLSATDKELQKAGLPDHVFGAMEGSNVSGFAVESMIAAAKDQIQPYITDLETHIADILDLVFYHFRNMGHLFTDDDQGRWYIPENGRGKVLSMGNGPSRPEFQQMMQMLMQMSGGLPPDLTAWQAMGMDESTIPQAEPEDIYLTREDVIAIGTRPEVKLRSVHLQNMTMLANVAAMLIDKKIWSRGRAMDEFNIKNPREEWNRILAEDAQVHPKMMELVMFPEALYNSGNMSAFMAYFSAVIAPILMQMQMGAAPPGGAGPEQTGGPSTVQGDSQPMMGQGPPPGAM